MSGSDFPPPFPELCVLSWNARSFLCVDEVKLKHNVSYVKFLLQLAPIVLLQEVKAPGGDNSR